MMTNLECWKVSLITCLLFFTCWLTLFDASDQVKSLSDSGYRIAYPMYDLETKSYSRNPSILFTRKPNHWVQDLSDVTIPIVLCITLVIGANMRKWGFNLWWMWVFYFILTALNRKLTLGQMPYGMILEISVMIIQIGYMEDCWIRFRENQ